MASPRFGTSQTLVVESPANQEKGARFSGQPVDVQVSQDETTVDGLPDVKGRVKSFGYGATTGLLGGLGELEKFGAYTVPEMVGFEQPEQKPTLFPTTQDVQRGLSKVGIQRPSEELRDWEQAGEFVGGVAPALPGMVRGGARRVLGVPTETREALAREGEALGFRFSPAQVRELDPMGQRGATGFDKKNQTLANRLASKSTGKEVAEIDDKFIRSRLKELGQDFDRVFKGNQFTIDQPAIHAIQQISQFEQLLPTSISLSNVRKTVDNFIQNYQKLTQTPGAIPKTFSIDGEALQTIRNDLTSAARSASDRSDARRIYELVDTIDDSIARNYPKIAAELNRIRPLYRNTVVLEDLMRQRGIRGGDISLEQLGTMLGNRREGVRRIGGDLDRLGRVGEGMQLRAMWQREGVGADASEDILKKALGTTMGGLASVTGLRSRLARATQRQFERTPPVRGRGPTTRLPAATAAGTTVRPFQGEEP